MYWVNWKLFFLNRKVSPPNIIRIRAIPPRKAIDIKSGLYLITSTKMKIILSVIPKTITKRRAYKSSLKLLRLKFFSVLGFLNSRNKGLYLYSLLNWKNLEQFNEIILKIGK